MSASELETPQVFATACRHWRADRPCAFHKKDGVECECHHYDKVAERVLVIKLDAMGDVLRSTCVLPWIRQRFRSAWIEWVTRPESTSLLHGNPLVDRVITYGTDALLALSVTPYHWVVNLDAARTSCELATLANGLQKTGFLLDGKGQIVATNAAARVWLAMGVSDRLKRANTRSYQDLMADILGVPGAPVRYIFELSRDEVTEGERQLRGFGWQSSRRTLGLATGAGSRWPLKQWREDAIAELIERASQAWPDLQIVLLGGPQERERNRRLKIRFPSVIDPGCENEVRRFAALVCMCDVVVTGDTLAMHIALALERRAVILFGPTSASEIETYGLGEKVVPDMTCLSCYKTSCDFVPNCMDLISVDMVQAAVERQLAIAGADGARSRTSR